MFSSVSGADDADSYPYNIGYGWGIDLQRLEEYMEVGTCSSWRPFDRVVSQKAWAPPLR